MILNSVLFCSLLISLLKIHNTVYLLITLNNCLKLGKKKIKLTAKSPEIFAPAKIPVAAGKNTENTEMNVSPFRKSGPKFSCITSTKKYKIK